MVLHGAFFTSVPQVREHMDAFITCYNKTAKRFIWTQTQGSTYAASRDAASAKCDSMY